MKCNKICLGHDSAYALEKSLLKMMHGEEMKEIVIHVLKRQPWSDETTTLSLQEKILESLSNFPIYFIILYIQQAVSTKISTVQHRAVFWLKGSSYTVQYFG